MKYYEKILLLCFLLVGLLLFVMLIISSIIDVSIDKKANNFCEEIGYYYHEKIDGHFNCCLKDNVEVINERYEVVKDCIAGGTIEELK